MPRLVSDWKDAWKWLSTHLTLAGVAMEGYVQALTTQWDKIPDSVRELLPGALASKISMVLVFAGLLGSVIEQARKSDASTPSAS